MTVLWNGPAPQPIQWAVSRRHVRIAFEVPVTVRNGWHTRSGCAVNLSESGIAVLSWLRMNIADQVSVTFSLPHERNSITVDAIVRHARGLEHGLEFLGICPEEHAAIVSFIDTLANRDRL